MRLAKFLSLAGICSRRHAGRLIDEGLVSVNGEVAGHLTFVEGDELIIADGHKASIQPFGYVLYNKPVGINCVMNVNDPASITHKLHSQNLPNRLFPVGRLDKDSHGLLLLTNHGDLCHRLLSPDFVHSKRYLVTVEPHFGVSELGVAELGVAELGVNDSVAEQFVRSISAGVQIKGELTQPCQVEMLATNRFAITLTQGRNRQIRLMALAFGYRVVDLQRVSIVNLELADLPLDQWRSVDEEELAGLLALCEPAHQQV